MVLKGRYAIITGASQGLGAEIAAHFIAAGASVMLCARDPLAMEQTRARLEKIAQPGQAVLSMAADVANEEAVKALVAASLGHFPHIDILVNNAGIQGPIGLLEDVDWAEWLNTLQVNLVGLARLCRAVVPGMKARRQGKIINLSGGGATNPMPRMTAYAASKAAVVRFSESLALEVKEWGIDVNAVAPGALATRMLDEVLQAGPGKVGESYYRKMEAFKAKGGMPMSAAACCCTWLASAASDGVTGKLVAAQWDPYESFPQHALELEGDIYTLRRIVPKDRGQDWGND